MSVKARVVLEPVGDKKATVRVTHESGEEGVEPTVNEYMVGTTPVGGAAEYALQLGGKVSVQVLTVVELEYDKDQAALVEKPQAPVAAAAPPKAEPKTSSKAETKK